MGNRDFNDFSEETTGTTSIKIPIFNATAPHEEQFISGATILECAGVTATAAELNALDGITASVTELNQYVMTYTVADITAADSYFVVVPHAGSVTQIYTVIDDAITGDATFTFENNAGSVLQNGSGSNNIVITASGSAAGDIDGSAFSGNNSFAAGEKLEIINDGNASVGGRVTLSIIVTR